MLIELVYWLWLVLMTIAGAAVWFGWWCKKILVSPSFERLPKASAWPGFPWMVMVFTMMGVLMILHGWGLRLPDKVIIALILPWGPVGLFVGIFRWPNWALPPWYRELWDDRKRREREGLPQPPLLSELQEHQRQMLERDPNVFRHRRAMVVVVLGLVLMSIGLYFFLSPTASEDIALIRRRLPLLPIAFLYAAFPEGLALVCLGLAIRLDRTPVHRCLLWGGIVVSVVTLPVVLWYSGLI
ncbi:MAG: hypothetical protein EPO21_16840 [Chloroflexota bacterium]|nr:MAG: hypothetical protein EPO21_16840 [Chloroflexota bacterium]